MAQPKLPIEARRIRMIIVTLPIMAATSYVLYKRHVLGESQRHLPTTLDGENSSIKLLDSEDRDQKIANVYTVVAEILARRLPTPLNVQ